MKRFQLPRVSVIGSAGRKGDGTKMTTEIYNRAVDKAREVITNKFKLNLERIHLVSGGAAWTDHIAISLFLSEDIPALTLHFPTEWQTKPTPQFTDNGHSDFKRNPGGVANHYHKHFSEKIGENSLMQIQTAIDLAATVKSHNGFKERNTHIADSEFLVAFTWSEGDIPKKGGTSDTWEKCSGKKIHIPYSSLSISSTVSKCSPRKRKCDNQIGPLKRPHLCSEESEIDAYVGSSEASKPLVITPVVQSDEIASQPIVDSTESHEEVGKPPVELNNELMTVESSDEIAVQVIVMEQATIKQNECDSNAVQETCTQSLESGYYTDGEEEIVCPPTDSSNGLEKPDSKEDCDTLSPRNVRIDKEIQLQTDSSNSLEKPDVRKDCETLSPRNVRVDEEILSSQLQASSSKSPNIEEDYEHLLPCNVRVDEEILSSQSQTDSSNSPEKPDIRNDHLKQNVSKSSGYKFSDFIAEVLSRSDNNEQTSQHLTRQERQLSVKPSSQYSTSNISAFPPLCQTGKPVTSSMLPSKEKYVCKDSYWTENQSYNLVSNNISNCHRSARNTKPNKKVQETGSRPRSKRTKNVKTKQMKLQFTSSNQ